MMEPNDKPCQRCGKDSAIAGERFCKKCKAIVLTDGRKAHKQERMPKHGDRRGRKLLEGGRSMDWHDGFDVDSET